MPTTLCRPGHEDTLGVRTQPGVTRYQFTGRGPASAQDLTGDSLGWPDSAECDLAKEGSGHHLIQVGG
jgi:hypothetical protein